MQYNRYRYFAFNLSKSGILFTKLWVFLYYVSIFSKAIFFFIDYQSSFNGPSTPFLRFDNVSEEFIFEIKTKSFVEDDFSLGEKPLSNK